MATIFNDPIYQYNLGRAPHDPLVVWSDCHGMVFVEQKQPQIYKTTLAVEQGDDACFWNQPVSGHNTVSLNGIDSFYAEVDTKYPGDEKIEVPPKPKAQCPDCLGNKVYVGLFKTETCASCNGTGEV